MTLRCWTFYFDFLGVFEGVQRYPESHFSPWCNVLHLYILSYLEAQQTFDGKLTYHCHVYLLSA